MEAAPSEHTRVSSSASYTGLFWYAVAALALAVLVRFFIAAPYIVSGASMAPTFESLHYLIIDRVTYELDDPQRGDVVVFRFPQDPSRSFIKRVIALPGETIELNGTRVTITNDEHPEGFILEEDYIAEANMRESNLIATLTDDEYFVLGDNRLQSADSRVWGALPREFVTGRVYLRLFPFSQIDILPGEARYQGEELADITNSEKL